jgi:hypothetical protein
VLVAFLIVDFSDADRLVMLSWLTVTSPHWSGAIGCGKHLVAMNRDCTVLRGIDGYSRGSRVLCVPALQAGEVKAVSRRQALPASRCQVLVVGRV